jgi:hypothetical protein
LGRRALVPSPRLTRHDDRTKRPHATPLHPTPPPTSPPPLSLPSPLQVAGVFESIQPSDTDLGAKAPKDIKIQGLWYAQLS